MKKILFAFSLVLEITFFSSCKKSESHSFWKFDDHTFNPSNSSYININGSTGDNHYFLSCNGSNADSYLTIFFPNTSGNPPIGTSSVIAYDSLQHPSGNDVSLNLAQGTFGHQVHYYATGNTSDHVQVYMNGGKVAVKGTGIHLVNRNNASDTGTLDFDVTQSD